MRFLPNGPDISDELLNARDEGKVVFFCGSGVSFQACGLPGFHGLAAQVLTHLKATEHSEASIKLAEIDPKNPRMLETSLDEIFSFIEEEFPLSSVQTAVAQSLKPSGEINRRPHRALLDLARDAKGETRLLTTNFDRLFDVPGRRTGSICWPKLPDLRDEDRNWGVVYLHGRVSKGYEAAENGRFILSSADFGAAYMAQGWVREFIKSVLSDYTAVFVGYSADDPPMRYLLQGLHREQAGDKRHYALGVGIGPSAERAWQRKGITPIIASDWHMLWETVYSWSERSRDPDGWRERYLKRAAAGPTSLTAHERGMVAHIVSSELGAKAFTASNPDPEWLAVFDRKRRYSGPTAYTEDTKRTKSPFEMYRIDSDPEPPAKGLISEDAQISSEEDFEIDQSTTTAFTPEEIPSDAWDAFLPMASDTVGSSFGTLAGSYAPVTAHLSARVASLAWWIANNCNSPKTLWWAAHQSGLHPSLIENIEWKLASDKSISSAAKETWYHLFEAWRTNQRGDRDIHLFRSSAPDDWTPPYIRRICNLLAPSLELESRSVSSYPPTRRTLQKRGLVRFSIDYPERHEQLDVPDKALSDVLGYLRRHLEDALLLEGTHRSHFDITFLITDGLNLSEYTRDYGLSGYVLLYLNLFRKLAATNITEARKHLSSWPANHKIFDRLRLWACQNSKIVSVSALDTEFSKVGRNTFWDYKAQRALLLTLQARWSEFPQPLKKSIETRLLQGPAKYRKETADGFQDRKAFAILNRLHALARSGCDFTFDLGSITEKLQKNSPKWKSEYAESATESTDMRGGIVLDDNDPKMLLNVPLREIIDRAWDHNPRGSNFLVRERPFYGLCEQKPARALGALRHSSASTERMTKAWDTYLAADREREVPARRLLFVASILVEMDEKIFTDILDSLVRWLKKHSHTFREANIFDQLWNKIFTALSASAKARASSIDHSSKSDVGDWATAAINSVPGEMAEILMADPAKQISQNDPGLHPDFVQRAQQLFSLPDNARRYAKVIFGFNLSWLYYHVPDFANEHFVVHLEQASQDAEAIWAGFFWGAKVPPIPLYLRLKPLLLERVKVLAKRKKHTEILAGMLLAGWANVEGGRHLVSATELHDALVDSDDEFRQSMLWQLMRWSTDRSSKVASTVPEFVRDIWPKQKSVQSPRITETLCDLAMIQDDDFPAIVGLIKSYLTKLSGRHFMTPLRYAEENNLIERFPDSMFDLLDTVLPDDPGDWPYKSKEVLKRIVELHPNLKKDFRYARLRRGVI